MIEVNFFEKKQINVLPYILSGIFIVAVALIGAYFYFTHSYYVNAEQDHSQWMVTNSEEVALSREIEQLDQLATQSTQVQETLIQSQFPMGLITDDFAAVISNEEARVSSFLLGETNQVILLLENTEVTDASEIINELEQRDYIDRVQLLRLENQQSDSEDFIFEITIDLDISLLNEEAEE